jgi:glycosyltransferase involved in cell wall biosynthesis
MRVAILRRAPQASFSMDVYADSLVKGLRAVRPSWDIVERSPVLGARQFNLLSGGQKYYERYWRYPRSLKRLDADIFHIIDHSDGYLSYWLNVYQKNNVVTCHDLINLTQPESFAGKASLPLVSLTAWKLAVQGMKTSDHVIAVSAHTKKDTVAQLAIAPQKITVVPNAVDPLFRPLPPDKIDFFRQQQGLSPDTVCLLNVGSNNARKNILTVLQVLALLKQQGLSAQFWKVGADFDLEQQTFIQTHQLEACTAYLGQPTEDQLVQIYNAADILVAPSLYEGFGLTLLEAMACGTAVVAANVTAIPEVVGDAGMLIDPMDVDAIAAAIQHLHSDSRHREDLIHRGLERVKQFTWEKTAEQVANIYEQVLEKAGKKAGNDWF